MTMDKKLEKIFVEILKIDVKDINDNYTMHEEDVWDSLAHMELVTTIEKEFNLQLSFDEITIMQTFGKIKELLKSKLDC